MPTVNNRRGIISYTGGVEMKQKLIRVAINVTEDTFKDLERYRDYFGLTRTTMGGMCLMIGLRQLVRTFAPEETIDDEMIERILRKARELGLQ